MELLLGLDRSLFYLINQLPHTPLSDSLFVIVSQSVWVFWVIFFAYIFIPFLFHRKNAGRGFVFLVAASISGFVLNTFGFKDFFRRPRPFLSLPEVALVERGLLDYSFPSGHAFSAALLATLFVQKKKFFWFLFPYVLLVGFSRIYLGVHFPLDVAAGLAFGLIYGLSVKHFYQRFLEKEEFHVLNRHLNT